MSSTQIHVNICITALQQSRFGLKIREPIGERKIMDKLFLGQGRGVHFCYWISEKMHSSRWRFSTNVRTCIILVLNLNPTCIFTN